VNSLLFLLAAAAGALLPCSYRKAGDSEIASHGACASRAANGTIRIARSHLRLLDYGSDGLAAVFVEPATWAYVRRDGATLEVLAFDNGPDDFSDGRVRIRRGGKIGYADRSFRTVIAPRFDFGWPFEEGRALVCNGCRAPAATPGKEDHSPVSGGKWGYIDPDGREVVPIRLSREEAMKKYSGR
jgi:hypothetical protein